MHLIRSAARVAAVCSGLLGAAALAQPGVEPSPLQEGAYVALFGTRVVADGDAALQDGEGGQLLLGLRRGWYAIEGGGGTASLGQAQQTGGQISGLIFPFSSGVLSGFYGAVGVGALEVKDYPGLSDTYAVTTAEAGVGYLVPLSIGRYAFGVRVDARYRYSRREEELNLQQQDLPIPNSFTDQVIAVGLHLPLGFKPVPPPAATPEAAEVVPLEDTTSASDAP